MKLTIVIPIYGVEKYIEKCLMSCILQDAVLGTEYEIVCVNDGSLDRSAEIAKQIASNHKGLVVIDQDNGGLSDARNTGLYNARGEYVWFVDSDDWISERCLGRIISKLINQIDILQLQYCLTYEDSKSIDAPFTIIDGIKSGREITLLGGLPAPAQFSIFRRKFLIDNKLEFVKGIFHEDSEFKPRAVYLAKKVASDDVVSYNYYQRATGSIMSSFSLKRANDLVYVNNSLYNFSQNLDKEIQRAINTMIGLNFNSLFYGYWSLPTNERRIIKEILSQNKHLLECMKNCTNIKYRIEGYILRINLKTGLLFYKLLRICLFQ